MDSGPVATEGSAAGRTFESALARALKIRKPDPGDRYVVVRSADGRLLHATLDHGARRAVLVPDAAGGYRTSTRRLSVYRRVGRTAGVVHGTLWPSMLRAGAPNEAVAGLIRAFRWTVDFASETRDGDVFAAIWTERVTESGTVLDRTVDVASYKGPAAGSNVAVRFADEYFDAGGRSLKRRFLRAPLHYSRISSGFSSGRYHPILKFTRPHKGVDYAAPRGTPVFSVADGTIVRADRDPAFGNVVTIKHDEVYSSLYGHLSRFARGLRPGRRVHQGAVIGYVGSTGLATGPHLHFQIGRSGQWQDYTRIDLPFGRRIQGAQAAAFAAVARAAASQIRDLVGPAAAPVTGR